VTPYGTSSSSGVATLVSELLYLCYFTLTFTHMYLVSFVFVY